ncbi:MAG: hypothetical protein GY867_12215, partial [bacterium]|nr:hypothetical protein [bacterium]
MTKTTLTLLALALLMCIGVARADSVNLTWTAPGDDDRVGTATLYDLRYSQAPINDYNWDDATRVTGVLAPRPSGTPESHTVDGLASGQTYYFALRTADEALNWSTLSNVVAKSIVPESIAPSSIADFSSVSSTQTSITLTWSAPGDDGQDGTASEYDLRCAEFAISESNWNSAARVSGVSAPASAGSAETFTCTGLNPSTQYHYAIKTSDEVPNWSGISNLVTASTASENVNLPPAEIADLQELDATISSVSLTWTAPGSEGNVGTATQYDLRYATVPIDESNWTSSTVLEDLAAPQTAGSVESCVISGLEAATTYYFALKTADEVPQWSGLSNIAAARTTSDISYPLEITDLAGTGHAMTSVSLAWTAPGAADGSASAVEYDLRFANYEITPSNWATANRVRTIGAPNTAGTSEALTVGALTPNIKYYFAIKAADQSTNWSAMSNVITRTTGAETTAPSDIADLEGTETTETSVTLSWTAPGDDGVNGTASAYDLRCAEFAINESNWNSATHVSGVPSPVGAGGAETFTCTGLNPGTRYYFAIKASDEVSNWSGVSNLVTANTVPEVVNLPPSAIADLIGTDVTTSSVSLSWTAPGADDTKGTASQYDLRYATSPIGESNWNSATVLEGLTLPQPAGSVETYTISGLDPDTDYYFAVKTADEVPQWSGLSNIVQVQTSAEASYPLEITDLAGTGHTTTSVSLAWTAPGAEDGSQSAVEYDLRFANYEIAESNWASANRVRTIGAPKPAGTDEAFTVGALTPNITYYFAIKAADQSGDWSAMSNVVSRRTGSEIVAPSDITDLEGVEATETSVTLSWTAPGDNGISGTASEYDLRYAVETITAANWNTIARLEGLAAPLEAGSVETYTISGLEPGREHFFAVRTADEVPNWSGISNVVSVQTSVVNLPPGIISNLAATEVTTSSATLTWSATGADGEIGTATTYDLGCATEPITESNWGVVTHIAGLPSPSASGNAEIFTVNALEPETQYYFAVKACDEIAQWSALSNVVDLITKAENQPPVAIASLAAEQITARTLTLTWTAPAD